MLRILTANDPRFKEIVFTPGLNVVLAERTLESSDQQTRNGSGKSSLVRVLHFLLGANAGSTFRAPEFEGWVFALGLDVGSRPTIVARSTADTSRIHVLDQQDGYRSTRLRGWKDHLGRQWFGLRSTAPRFAPSLRSLLGYLVRQADEGGMVDPFKTGFKQQLWDSQVAISYLLGLDWHLPSRLAAVRDDEKSVDALTKAAQAGDLGAVVGSAAKLRTQLAVARDDANSTRQRLESFKVLDTYRGLQLEADDLTRRLRELSNHDATDRDLLADLERAMTEVSPPGAADLERLWAQANVVLPEAVVRSYEEAQIFHESVISNRVNYLSREADGARQRIEERGVQRSLLGERRRMILTTLESGGALEEFAGMQAELGRQQGIVAVLEERLRAAESLESGKARVAQQRQELFLQLQEDYHDREAILGRVITLFERYSRRLYDDRRGSLVVEPSLNGPRFRVEILGSGSVGIDSMQVLCFDLALMTILAERGEGPGFLVHDSHIFDGVDERQVANALALGSELADDHGFQYLVTLNEDDVPRSFPGSFDFGEHVNDVRLTDATESGGLFGLRLR